MQGIPKEGIQGLKENWQSDSIAAISVALVALPLALGIAIASGVPPMAGVMSAIIGGVVTTFFRGSHVAINGPAAGLIAVVLAAIAALDDGTGQALNYVLAAIVVSGGIQVILGLLKLGRFADIFHSSVIHGILAAIGVIIFAKQIHFALGTKATSPDIIQTLVDVFHQIQDINPFVFIISLVGLFLLIFHSKISYKFFHFLPAPMWVLLISIPFVYAFNFFEVHNMVLFGRDYEVGPALLISIPDNILASIAHPNFSKIDTLPFWSSVLSITMIASIESLASAKAVDKLDPYQRKTDLNKDLVGIGISTMASGALGGLPIINVIVRSTVNIHNNGKTKWSNLYHGILLLLFIFILTPIIQQVPLCALAILLVYTGYKLASPKVFKHVYDQGIEQLIFFVGTLGLTLYTDLLVGIFGGLLLALVTHLLLARVPITTFFQMIFKSGSNLVPKPDGSYDLKMRGIANFLGAIKIEGLLSQVPAGAKVNIDLSETRLVDFSIMEHFDEFKRTQVSTGGSVTINGLDKHISSSNHKFALKIQTSSPQPLSTRQSRLQEMATAYGWNFQTDAIENIDYFQSFYFFKTRPIEAEFNCISDKDEGMHLELIDVTFDEGAYLSSEEYDTTLGLLKLPFKIPKFTIKKKDLLDKYLHISEHKDIDYQLYTNFSKDYLVRVKDIAEMDIFLTERLKVLIEISGIHHLESNGEAILIFNNNFKLAEVREYARIIQFAENFKKMIKEA